ncbi:MAG: bifunctional phosphoribosyl-AMP cyclohydrolase/phosphoribosyl-ATP diphosphatase HisIE [Pseudomonadota bacterium]
MSIASGHEERVAQLAWDKAADGLLPAVVQDADDGGVLMLAYMNREALAKTLRTGLVTFYSRSRQQLWTKGETSGHTLALTELRADCDGDTLLVQARPAGPVCHLLTPTCFDAEDKAGDGEGVAASPGAVLGELESVIDSRAQAQGDGDTGGSYVAKLLGRGRGKVAQKVGEEGVEVALAVVGEDDESVVGEAADLLFHLLVALKSRDLSLRHVTDELARRRR